MIKNLGLMHFDDDDGVQAKSNIFPQHVSQRQTALEVISWKTNFPSPLTNQRRS